VTKPAALWLLGFAADKGASCTYAYVNIRTYVRTNYVCIRTEGLIAFGRSHGRFAKVKMGKFEARMPRVC